MGTHNCNIMIDNTEASRQLVLIKASNMHGSWATPPPSTIQKGQVVDFELDTDVYSPYGAEGQVVYGYGDNETQLIFHFSCPVSESNTATAKAYGELGGRVSLKTSYGSHDIPLNASFVVGGVLPAHSVEKKEEAAV